MSQQYPQDPNQPQPPGGQPQVPPPGWTQPKPPKKPFYKRTWFIVVASIVGLIILVSVIPSNSDDTASSGSDTTPSATTSAPATQPKATTKPSATAPKTTEAPTTQPPAETKCTGNRNDPCPVKLGVAFTVGKHTMAKGWKLKTQEYLGTQLVGTITMTDKDSDPSTAFFTVKFLKGKQVVANFQCSSSDLEQGQSEDIECHNMSDVSKPLKAGSYDRITAEADF